MLRIRLKSRALKKVLLTHFLEINYVMVPTAIQMPRNHFKKFELLEIVKPLCHLFQKGIKTRSYVFCHN